MKGPQTKHYKGFKLCLCWCGYPEMRWMLYWGETWIGTEKTLVNAKSRVNEQRKLWGI
jgi:hypothetical protein